MEEEHKDFIGIYDESIPKELCDEFIDNYETAKKNETIIDLSKENELQILDSTPEFIRKDEVMMVGPTFSNVYPRPPVNAYFDYLQKCLVRYMNRYNIEFHGTIFNDVFKIHKVKKSEGYHTWHYERNNPQSMDRIFTYMTYLEVPKSGGETEFLHQSLRIDPKVGRTLIWPAGYTHAHRGNPPLEGEKMYITGWFTGGRDPLG